MKNIAIFASGSGSDMQSVIDAVESGKIDGRVVAVVTNKEGIYALERAKKHNIESRVFTLADYKDNASRDKAISDYLKDKNIDLIVLAGYIAIVTPVLVDEYAGRIINIHPSLIPKHCGVGMYGLNVHKSVLASGDKESGCTVHYVDHGADTGKIIEQRRVPVLEGDTPESLQARILEVEHVLLPEVVAKLCNVSHVRRKKIIRPDALKHRNRGRKVASKHNLGKAVANRVGLSNHRNELKSVARQVGYDVQLTLENGVCLAKRKEEEKRKTKFEI